MTATAGTGSSFSKWQKDGVDIAGGASIDVTVEAEATYTAVFTLNQYTITVEANNDAFGTVTGGGTFDYGTTHTLTATAKTGSPFAKWLKDGNEISTSESTEITVDGDALYVAVFVLNEYTIGANTSGDGSGTVEGNGTYNHGSSVTLTATANTGSTFNGWYKGNQQVSANAQYTFNATESATYTANFTLNEYTITTNTSGNGSGTVSGGGQHKYGTKPTLTASANTGSTFTKWNDGVETASRQIEVTKNDTYTAIFTLNKYTITTNTSGNGTVTAGGTYDYETPITLTATAGTGSSFSKWQKDGVDIAGGASIDITVEAEATYTAVFTVNQYTITVVANDENYGNVSGSGTFTYGTSTQISATPNASYNFGGWNDGNTDNPRTITVIESKTYTATFTQKVYYGVSVEYDSEMGDVSGTGSFEVGTPINLVATPKTGYTFEKWSDGKTSATYPEFTLTENVSLGATFKPIAYTITGVANPAAYGTVTVAGGNSHDYNTDVTLTASANYGYKFLNWADNGSVIPERSVHVTDNASYTANFGKDQFHVYVNSNNNTMGNVSGAGNYDYLDEATLTATPETGYIFSKWQKDGIDYEGGASINVTVDAEATYTAFFSPDSYAITIEKEGEGTTSGDGTYEYNTNAILTANAAVGYTFIRWEKDGVQISAESSYTAKVTADATYKAVFEINSYNIAVATSGNGAGTVTGNNLYYHGDDVTLEATENIGSSFSGWYKGDEKVSDDNTYSFKATETTTYTAWFTLNKYALTTATSGNGTVTNGGEYDYGTEVEIEATANEGSEFVEWAEDHLTTLSRKVTVLANCTYTAVFKLQQFYISATSANITMGSVSGSGTYNYGETATIKANAEYGYEFDKWNNDDELTNPELQFEVTGEANYIATFKNSLYTITAVPNNDIYGTVTGITSGEKYEFGSEHTITANANDHYHFVSWENGMTNDERTFTVNGDMNITATFSPDQYTVSVHSDNDVMGSATGSGLYDYLEVAEIEAVPNYGFDFTNWSDESTEASRSITVTQAVDLTALFTFHKFNVELTSNNDDYGTVSGAGQFNYEADVEISATPEYGYTFSQWNDGVTDATRTISLTQDTAFEASFELRKFYIGTASNDTSMGSISGAGYYYYLENATLIATPKYGYEFIQWSNDETDSIINVEVNKNDIYSALFKAKHFELSAIANDTAMGSVEGGGTYIYNDTVTLTATPKEGYKFLGWSNGSTDSIISVAIISDIELTAIFANEDAIVYTVSLAVNNETMGTVSGANNYVKGETVTISATANTGYHFVNWSDGDTNTSRNIIVVSDTTLTANFEAIQYTLTVQTSDSTMGTAAGNGTFTYGSTASISATPNTGYQFVNWSDGDTNASREIIVVSDTTLIANFEAIQYTLTVQTSDSTMGTAIGNGTFTYGDTASISATPNTGYHFVNWNDGDTNASREIIVVSDTTLIANFEADVVEIQTKNYLVAHLLQQLDSSFTIFATDTLAGFADSLTAAVARTFEGFTAQSFEQVSITDSTVVNILYSRNSYTLTWLADSISITDSCTNGSVLFGAEIVAPKSPEKQGYTFAGWSADVPETMPTTDLTFTATWTAIIDSIVPDSIAHDSITHDTLQYIVAHYKQNLDSSYTLAATDTLIGIADSLTAAVALTFEGFTAQAFEQVIIVNSISPTVVNINYNRNKYELKWELNGGTIISSNYTKAGQVAFGTPIVAPDLELKDYAYIWETMPETMPANDITLSPIWTPGPIDEHFDFTVPATFNGCENMSIEVTDCQTTNVKFEWSVNGVVDESQTGLTFNFPKDAPVSGIITVTGTAFSGNESSSWSHEIPYTLRKNIITTMWDDVITVVDTAGEFESFKWYHNDVFVSDKAYYCEEGGLTGNYYLIATTSDGEEYNSCAQEFSVPEIAAIKAYPNPTTDKIRVQAGNWKAGDRLTITDGNGKIWRSTIVCNPDGEEFDLSSLPQGIYTIKVGNESVNVIKL